MTAPSLAYQDAMNGIAILYDALSNAENELDKFKNPWIKYDKCVPAEDDYYLVYRPKYEPPIAVAIYDSDLWGWFDYADDEVSHWQPLPAPPKDK